MLQLVAEAAGHNALAAHLKEVAVAVLGPHGGGGGTGDYTVLPWHGQTALQTGLLSIRGNDLGVDQLHHVLLVIHDNDHSAQDTDLGSGQAHAIGLGQSLLHIVQQIVQLLVKFLHRVASLSQCRISLGQNGSQRHC